jgi:hypothetical protein
MVNSLSLNHNKTYYMQFKCTSKPLTNTTAILDDIHITNVGEVKFLGVYIHDTINWKDHVGHIIPKLSRACCIMRFIKPCISINIFNMVCYSYFHSIMAYGLPFWGNSSHSIKAFRMQKYII